MASTCGLLAQIHIHVHQAPVAYIQDLDNGVLAESMPDFRLVYEMPPLPEGL